MVYHAAMVFLDSESFSYYYYYFFFQNMFREQCVPPGEAEEKQRPSDSVKGNVQFHGELFVRALVWCTT